METVNFKINGRHETVSGTAEIVLDKLFIEDYAKLSFDSDDVTVREIGLSDGYHIYESYVDSGSDDYVYFAWRPAYIISWDNGRNQMYHDGSDRGTSIEENAIFYETEEEANELIEKNEWVNCHVTTR